MLFNSRTEIGQGARRRCPVCNLPISIKSTGRPAKFCSDRCRQESFRLTGRPEFRDRFHDSSVTPDTGSALPRNPKKSSANSINCEGSLADRGSAINAPIVVIGLGCHAGPQPPEESTERAALIRNAIRLEFAARWSKALRP